MKKIFGSIIMLWSIVQFATAQSSPKLFLNCRETCYEDFLKQELTSFIFVRDRFLSDIEILIIEQESGNNGKFYTIELIGREPSFSSRRSTASFNTNAGDTQDIIRNKLLRNIKLGLFKLMMDSVWEKYFEIEVQPANDTISRYIKDKWNSWVFSPGVDGYVWGESNYSYQEIKGYLNVRRITVKNKLILSAEYQHKFNKYVLDSTLSLGINTVYIKPLYAVSLNRHWSLGMLGNYTLDEYRNIRTGLKIAPVLEYNIFPIEVNARKQLRIAYQIGLQYWEYFRPTIYDQLSEYRPYHKLSVITEIVQPWGNIRSALHGSQYLDRVSQNRLTLDLLISMRLFKGFTFNVEGAASVINDQISLVREALDETVYLLGGQQLPTTFSFWSSFGFSYTFGSIHNTIVNPRLGQVD